VDRAKGEQDDQTRAGNYRMRTDSIQRAPTRVRTATPTGSLAARPECPTPRWVIAVIGRPCAGKRTATLPRRHPRRRR